jgi:propanol-preferring alcohol dehydrogenase
MCRRKGTVVCIALPAGSFPCPIIDVVLKRLTIRGSIVGTRKDMKEALDFASRGLVCCDVAFDSIDNISDVFHRLRTGQIKGRVVIKLIEDREDSTEQDILDFA